MEVKIKYSELQDFILHNFKKEVSLAFVAPSTVSVSTKIKFLGFAKSIGVELCVEKVDGSNLHIAYSGKLGVELAHPTNPVEGCADANPKTELPNDT